MTDFLILGFRGGGSWTTSKQNPQPPKSARVSPRKSTRPPALLLVETRGRHFFENFLEHPVSGGWVDIDMSLL